MVPCTRVVEGALMNPACVDHGASATRGRVHVNALQPPFMCAEVQFTVSIYTCMCVMRDSQQPP
jgi:hypothetical protein